MDNEYLQREFRRYFPDCTDVSVENLDEQICVTIQWSDNFLQYRMDVESDDGWFAFFNDEMQSTLTIPFA